MVHINVLRGLSLVALTVGASDIVTIVDDEVLVSVVVATGEVALENSLGAVGITDLGVDGGTGHVGNHGVAAAPGALDVAQRVILGGGLREPDITSVASQVTRLDGLGDVLLDNDGTTSGVDEPRAWRVVLVSEILCRFEKWHLTLLHLGDEVLVEQTTSLLVQRAVDGNDITLSEHLLEVVNTAAADLLLDLRGERLVVVVEQLLAVERLETAQDTLTDAADSDSSDDLVLQIVLVLGNGSNVPFAVTDLLMGRNEVAD